MHVILRLRNVLFKLDYIKRITDRHYIINANSDITYPHFQMLDMPPVEPHQMFFLDSP